LMPMLGLDAIIITLMTMEKCNHIHQDAPVGRSAAAVYP
jgi:hypothetical protein